MQSKLQSSEMQPTCGHRGRRTRPAPEHIEFPYDEAWFVAGDTDGDESGSEHADADFVDSVQALPLRGDHGAETGPRVVTQSDILSRTTLTTSSNSDRAEQRPHVPNLFMIICKLYFIFCRAPNAKEVHVFKIYQSKMLIQ